MTDDSRQRMKTGPKNRIWATTGYRKLLVLLGAHVVLLALIIGLVVIP